MTLTNAIREEYFTLFLTCRITAPTRIEAAAQRVMQNRRRYEAVEKKTGVPWFWIGLIHNLESSCSFSKHLHNGDPLTARTVRVPKGRPVTGKPPFTWEQSAIDALQQKNLHKWSEWNVAGMLYQFERYNGFGYRRLKKPHPSPYLWAGSNHWTKGKFVSDGKYDANAGSSQAGAGAVLYRLCSTAKVALRAG